MTITRAQEIVANQGFAWKVTRVEEGNATDLIYCDWKGKEHIMVYSNLEKKIISIK